jgi:hypothetical protein
VSLGLGAAALVAAAACFIRIRRRSARAHERSGPDGSQPLLPIGAGSAAGAAAEDAGVAAQRLQLSREAEYDPLTNFPANLAAKQLAGA